MDALVSTEWLAGELGAADLRVVDASYFLPAHGRNAAAEHEAAHIPGAVFMDLLDQVLELLIGQRAKVREGVHHEVAILSWVTEPQA